MAIVVLDPGHGGSDPGATGNGLKEKDLTLDIAKRTRDILEANYNVTVKMTRTGDTYPSLSERANYANRLNANLFVSIHINAGGGTGYEDYRFSSLSESSQTGKHQKTLHEAIYNKIKGYGIRDRGTKSANLAVLRETTMVAFLTENLFIDTSADAELLKQSGFKQAVAQGHADGIAKILGLKKKGGGSKSEYYVVKSGDSLSRIAAAHKTTLSNLLKLNPQITNPDKIYVGQRICVK